MWTAAEAEGKAKRTMEMKYNSKIWETNVVNINVAMNRVIKKDLSCYSSPISMSICVSGQGSPIDR